MEGSLAHHFTGSSLSDFISTLCLTDRVKIWRILKKKFRIRRFLDSAISLLFFHWFIDPIPPDLVFTDGDGGDVLYLLTRYRMMGVY
jgi:hypothetical protein